MSYATNLDKNLNGDDICSYKNFESISEIFDFIDRWIPHAYGRSVLALLEEEDAVDLAYIRQVKRDRIKNPKIINAMLRVAQFNKFQLEEN